MYAVLVAMLPVLVTLVVAVVCITMVVVTVAVTVAVMVAVLFAFSVAGRPLFVVPGTVSLPAVRTTAVVLFVVAFVMFAALLTEGAVFLVGR